MHPLPSAPAEISKKICRSFRLKKQFGVAIDFIEIMFYNSSILIQLPQEDCMSSLDRVVQTQLANIQKKTGMPLNELADSIKRSGLTRHSEIRDMLKERLGLGHGDANMLVHHVLKSDSTSAAEGKSTDAVLDEIYSGPKAGFRPIHE